MDLKTLMRQEKERRKKLAHEKNKSSATTSSIEEPHNTEVSYPEKKRIKHEPLMDFTSSMRSVVPKDFFDSDFEIQGNDIELESTVTDTSPLKKTQEKDWVKKVLEEEEEHAHIEDEYILVEDDEQNMIETTAPNDAVSYLGSTNEIFSHVTEPLPDDISTIFVDKRDEVKKKKSEKGSQIPIGFYDDPVLDAEAHGIELAEQQEEKLAEAMKQFQQDILEVEENEEKTLKDLDEETQDSYQVPAEEIEKNIQQLRTLVSDFKKTHKVQEHVVNEAIKDDYNEEIPEDILNSSQVLDAYEGLWRSQSLT